MQFIQASVLFLAVPTAFLSSGLVRFMAITAAILMIVTTPVHAEVTVKGLKPQAAPPTYEVDGKQVSAAEATIAVLRGGRAFKCQEMEVQESRSGISIKPKKSN